ncbi:DUF262 domain-containing protein [Thiothrix sp.]|uniref:DUF262 domain-containing protein n=1 Tax=Thiothrix sp. TaxID=1032 RepID=UPI002579C94C|nr:DUF262 domain-containing protein [Thiothrix sp.]
MISSDEDLDVNDYMIEDEIYDEMVEINIPFDPNKIKISNQPMSVGMLLKDLEYNTIKLDTEFQRLPNLWDNTKKSQLIESLLLRLPIPTFYFDGADDNKWRVIDGLQRISTLKSFVLDKSLTLEGMDFLREFNGYKFDALPRELQRRIEMFSLTVYVLEKGTPDDVKYILFSRLNRGGLVLTPQEIRNALHQGKGGASEFIKELVDDKNTEGALFIKATGGKIKKDRMQDRDFITRFISFYLIPYQKYEPDLDSFMTKGMGSLDKTGYTERSDLKDGFRKSMETAIAIFENDAFRKRFSMEDQRKPINKALFEVISVCFSKLTDFERTKLVEKKSIFITYFIELHRNEKFIRSITQSTAKKDNVEYRFNSILEIIKRTLEI